MKLSQTLLMVSLCFSFNAYTSVNHKIESLKKLDGFFKMNPRTPGLPGTLKKHAFGLKQESIPTLIKVMKEAEYPDQNRWQATMLLAQIMGKKSAPFIARFTEHPNWMMRVASLKALLGLGQKEYVKVYQKSLKDDSLIVRVQALSNISKLGLSSLGDDVWGMLYDESNYSGSVGRRKRTSIIGSVIRTLGDIKFNKASLSLAKLIQKPKYEDLAGDLDYSLEKITGKKSPKETKDKRKFWSYLLTKK